MKRKYNAINFRKHNVGLENSVMRMKTTTTTTSGQVEVAVISGDIKDFEIAPNVSICCPNAPLY
jgi:hypothetical protein